MSMTFTTPPDWLIPKVLAAMDRYPLALKLAKPSYRTPHAEPRHYARKAENLRQRYALVTELLKVYPYPAQLARVLGMEYESMRSVMWAIGVRIDKTARFPEDRLVWLKEAARVD